MPQAYTLTMVVHLDDTQHCDCMCLAAGWFCASRGEVDRMAEAYPDDATSAAVIGCGPVGLMAILAAQAQGAEQVSSIRICRLYMVCTVLQLQEKLFLGVYNGEISRNISTMLS